MNSHKDGLYYRGAFFGYDARSEPRSLNNDLDKELTWGWRNWSDTWAEIILAASKYLRDEDDNN